MLGALVNLSNGRVERGLSLTNASDVGLAFVDDALFALMALSSHLTEIVVACSLYSLASLLGLIADHLRLDAPHNSFLAGMLTSESSLFDSVLDLLGCEELALLEDLLASLAQFLSDWAQLDGLVV